MALLSSAAPEVASSGCGAAACTPDELGLGDETLLPMRRLEGVPTRAGACARERLEVITSSEELGRFDAEVGLTRTEPIPDFGKERVIVRQGRGGRGLQWVVRKGDTAIGGLLTCAGSDEAPSCFVEVVAVSGLFGKVETRSCETVNCGASVPNAAAR